MLQHVLIQRIERLYRLRLLYAAHLALYGMTLACYILTPAQPTLLLLLIWLPLVVAHTAAQTVLELRERCTVYQPIPALALSRPTPPVVIYDEDGRRVGEGDPLLPG